jgi:hypothetical protein
MKRTLIGAFALMTISLNALAADDSASPNTEIWRKVRADLFGERPIVEDGAVGRILLEMPARAADAAVVPLARLMPTAPAMAVCCFDDPYRHHRRVRRWRGPPGSRAPGSPRRCRGSGRPNW